MDAFVLRAPSLKPNHSESRSTSPNREESPRPPKRLKKEGIPDSESDDSEHEFIGLNASEDASAVRANRPTDFENVLPAAQPDEETLKEYEAFKLSQDEPEKSKAAKVKRPKWIRGQSSIYVDAFNLALDTVLEDESHLFSEKEKEVFGQWKSLNYEAQFLYEKSISSSDLYLQIP